MNNQVFFDSPEWKAFCDEGDKQFWGMLMGTIPIPPPPPRQEYWMTTDYQMVVVQDDGVHKTLSNPEDIDPTPYAQESEVKLWRRCTSFDF